MALEIDRSAATFLTPVLLNQGETLNFTMRSGDIRRVTVVDSGIDVYEDFGQRQWTLWAELLVDGQPLRLNYSPFSMKALYEPKVVNGMRIGLDGVRGLPDAVNIRGRGSDVNPPRDVRLWVNDASMPVIPNAHIWFELFQDRELPHPSTYREQTIWPVVDDYRIRQDRDVHPTTTGLTYPRPDNDFTNKTGWLGGWDYGLHRGLDIQLPVGTPLYAVTDDAIQRGYLNEAWRGGYYDVPDNDDTWRFGNLHLDSYVGEVEDTFDSGEVIAVSGTFRAGIAHTHAVMSFRPAGDERNIPLNPWIAMWQGLENRKDADGVIRASIVPPTDATVGEQITFSSEGSRAGNTGRSEQLSYLWIFSDGTRSTDASLARAFDQAGMHQAILIVDDGRLQDLSEVFFTVSGAEAAAAPRITLEVFADSDSEPNPLLPHVGSNVTWSLKAESAAGNPLEFHWFFSDGATAEGQTVTHEVSTPGRHFAVVTVTDTVTGRSVMDWYPLDTWEWPGK